MGNLLLTRKHNLPISFAFDLARLGFEAWMVIGLRTAKLAMGGPAAMVRCFHVTAPRRLGARGLKLAQKPIRLMPFESFARWALSGSRGNESPCIA